MTHLMLQPNQANEEMFSSLPEKNRSWTSSPHIPIVLQTTWLWGSPLARPVWFSDRLHSLGRFIAHCNLSTLTGNRHVVFYGCVSMSIASALVSPKTQTFIRIISGLGLFFPSVQLLVCLWYASLLCDSVWSNLKASMSRSTFWASPWTRMWFWNFLRASSSSMPWKSISSTTQLIHEEEKDRKIKHLHGVQQFLYFKILSRRISQPVCATLFSVSFIISFFYLYGPWGFVTCGL